MPHTPPVVISHGHISLDQFNILQQAILDFLWAKYIAENAPDGENGGERILIAKNETQIIGLSSTAQ